MPKSESLKNYKAALTSVETVVSSYCDCYDYPHETFTEENAEEVRQKP